MILGQKNVGYRALVDKTKMYVPPLHINVGLIKIFVKAIYIYIESEFDSLRQKFPHTREAKAFSSVLKYNSFFKTSTSKIN